MRQPPRSTLFPYTTLFRSFSSRCLGRTYTCFSYSPGLVQSSIWAIVWFAKELDMTNEDRKSTRLNSSHVESSYAVFCLKKKNEPLLYAGNALGGTPPRLTLFAVMFRLFHHHAATTPIYTLSLHDALPIFLVEVLGQDVHLLLVLARLSPELDLGDRLVREGVGHDERRSEEHTSELQSRRELVCRLLLEKKK